MKRYILIFAVLWTSLVLALSGCIEEQFPEKGGLAEGEGWLYIPFKAEGEVKVETKFTLDYGYENAIRNIYVFVFDKNGNKIYDRWLTSDDMLNSESAVRASDEDSWWVSNSSTEGVSTTGGLKIKASAGTGFKVYLMTNLDADMVKVSSDLLSHNIGNESDLLDFRVFMNVESVNRNGNFPMTGKIDNVTVTSGGGTVDVNTSGTPMRLVRMDAKIKFILKTGERPDVNGQQITSFTAKQWRVINVPSTAFAIDRGVDSRNVSPTDEDFQANAPYFFDTPWKNFEEFPNDKEASFSFYMLENRQTPKNTSFTSYNDRSRQIKTSAGLNETVSVEYVNSLGKVTNKDFRRFQNANDYSTYVLVTGRVDMNLINDDAGQTLGADVQYLIHLGNWNLDSAGEFWYDDVYSGVTNFNTERNHSYTYTVTVNSVNNIRVEVESSRDGIDGDIENQPGASGEVVIAKEEIALCDAHYVSKTMTFHANNFYIVDADGKYVSTADRLTWKVKTPFSEGAPVVEDGLDIADHLDYKWATFRLNKQDASGSYYSDLRRKFTDRVYEYKEVKQENKEQDGTDGLAGYHNDGCMDIIALVRYIKEQTALYVEYRNALRTDPNAENKSDFDNGMIGSEVDPLGPKICMTVFVNEFYYDAHPITDQKDPTLWKRFVNQPDRTLHILCDSNSSTDMESTATGSVITIQQKAIKTIYNTELDYTVLETAWGTESVQEYETVGLYNVNSSNSDSGSNTDQENGKANSVFEWGLAPTGATVANIEQIKSDASWGTYLNFEVDNDTPQLDDDYMALRYICMSRNRDNNGDGKITRDELRWYTASIKQLDGLFVGNGLLDPSSRLYNRSAADQKNHEDKKYWSQLIISSTHFSGKTGPIVVWAHEGLSTSSYDQVRGWWGEVTNYGVRCVRNLGLDDDAPIKEKPQDFIEHKVYNEGVANQEYHEFTCTHLNYAALRDFNSGELTYGDERSAMNQLYKKFETAPTKNTFDNTSFVNFNQNINDNGYSSVKAGYCPEGYRVPSQIELTMMALYGAGVSGANNFTRTYWSFGTLGSVGDADTHENKKPGFALVSDGTMTVEAPTTSTTRCVRDIRVE